MDAKLLKRYQSLVGALLYCAGNTRPDVSYSVSMLCRVMSRPTPDMYDEALRVLSYLYRTRELGLRYAKSDKPLAGQSDSDWAVRHSTSGWQFMEPSLGYGRCGFLQWLPARVMSGLPRWHTQRYGRCQNSRYLFGQRRSTS